MRNDCGGAALRSEGVAGSAPSEPVAPEVLGGEGSPPVAPAGTPPRDVRQLAALIESVLFVADRPIAVRDLSRALEVDKQTTETALEDLGSVLALRGVRLQRSNGCVRMVTAPESAAVVQRFLGLDSWSRLSQAALEVLAIIAYRQPITRPEIEGLRGVDSETPLRTLMARELVAPVGRRNTVGHPFEYATTFRFLEYFGLSSLSDLPPLESFTAHEEAGRELSEEMLAGGDADSGSQPVAASVARDDPEAGSMSTSADVARDDRHAGSPSTSADVARDDGR